MDRSTPTHSAIARHLKLRPTAAEKGSGYAGAASLVESVIDKGAHTWTGPDDAQHVGVECWCVVTVRGGKHYVPKSDLAPGGKGGKGGDPKPDAPGQGAS